jgi:hypothetical protein
MKIFIRFYFLPLRYTHERKEIPFMSISYIEGFAARPENKQKRRAIGDIEQALTAIAECIITNKHYYGHSDLKQAENRDGSFRFQRSLKSGFKMELP